jgi:hypothetical protein
MRRAGITWILWVALASCAALLVAGVTGVGMALRAGALPALDVHLTLDGRHALVIHNDLPCMPDEPPQRTCTVDAARREFQIIYSTPLNDQVLVSIDLPAR